MIYLEKLILTTEASDVFNQYNSTKSLLEWLGLLLLTTFIIVSCYFTTRFVANKRLRPMKHSNFKVIDTYCITQNKYMQLLQIGTRYIVIAITKDNITFIGDLAEDEILYREESGMKKEKEISFKKILSDLTGKNK